MNPTNKNHEPTTVDDLQDRLVDRGLTEIVGRETVPNLSARILAAAVPATAAPVAAASPAAQPVAPRTRPTRAFWASLIAAAMLLVCVTLALSPSLKRARQIVHGSHASDTTDFGTVAQKKSKANSELPHSNLTTEELISSINKSPDPEKLALLRKKPAKSVDPDVYQRIQKAEMPLSKSPDSGIEAAPGTEVHRYAVELEPNANIGLGGIINGASQPPSASMALAPAPVSHSASIDSTAENVVGMEQQLVRKRADPNSREDVLRTINKPATMWERRSRNRGLKMLVTPRVIVPEGEEERLGNFDYEEKKSDIGTGPGSPGDQYTRIVENPFIKAEGEAAVSTFSIDVDTASYTNVRQFLMQMNTLPPPDAVRIEELINYFDYNYAPPTVQVDAADTPAAPGSAGGSSESANENLPAPFAAHVEVAGCPWTPDHRLVRIGIKGRELDRAKRPQSNLVFLVDVSASMNDAAKLPLVVYGLRQLTRELGEYDRVAIVVYASSEGLVLPSTPGTRQDEIISALDRLQAGGSTAGGAGIQLAYQIAEDNFIEGGTNRVILCTDGDFNVGTTSTAELERMVEQKAKDTQVFLSVLGFGRGNLNDAMMEAISNRGNGNYSYVDNRREARRVLVEQLTGTLVTIAKDVKIQVEFNPRQVAGYRLIGYENRMLRTEDFNDDKKDAGEIGAGHTVTALYEIVPAGKPVAVGPIDDLKYQPTADSHSQLVDQDSADAASDISRELLTLKMRYKQPDGDTSRKLEWPVTDDGKSFSTATGDFQFAAAVAGFGMLLRDSEHKGNLTFAADLELARAGVGSDKDGYRAELVDMIRRAKILRGE